MNAVLIVAGGTGVRMGREVPKQYIELDGLPIILHTLNKFLQFDPEIKIIMVIAEGHRRYWDELSVSDRIGGEFSIAPGGKTRYESVKNGLTLIDDNVIIGIHDAVRPFVSLDTIKRCYEAAEESGSGIPVMDMEDSVRLIKTKGRSVHMNRSTLLRVQTPQVFRSEMIKNAYAQTSNTAFTDDASVFESLFNHATLVEGNMENIKITTPLDLKLASLLIQKEG